MLKKFVKSVTLPEICCNIRLINSIYGVPVCVSSRLVQIVSEMS